MSKGSGVPRTLKTERESALFVRAESTRWEGRRTDRSASSAQMEGKQGSKAESEPESDHCGSQWAGWRVWAL
jgi:hypothetical protein